MKSFIEEYDDGNLNFNTTEYRQGARVTCPFGLAEGYSFDKDGQIQFDTVRIHTGVDRSGLYNSKGQSIRNVVYSPFDFNRSSAIHYGPKISYGYLIQLFNDDYGFEMRIAHMNPNKDVLPTIKTILERGGPIKRNEFLGQSGEYGISGGLHTHTEFISQGMTCQTFDDLLYTKYQDFARLEYSDVQILQTYQNKVKWIGKPLKDMKVHMLMMKQDKGISFFNKFKFTYIDPNSKVVRTRYSSELLFDGL